MKRILFVFVVAILSIFTTQAQKLENSTLWKIEGNKLEKPSYLFGTIHITCDATIEADVKKALDEIVDVHNRYKTFAVLTQQEAIDYIDANYKPC